MSLENIGIRTIKGLLTIGVPLIRPCFWVGGGYVRLTSELQKHPTKKTDTSDVGPRVGNICWWFRNPANQLRLVVYPIIYKVFAPFQVVFTGFLNHQQYLCHWVYITSSTNCCDPLILPELFHDRNP